MTRSALRRLMTGVFAGIAAVFAATSAFGLATPRLKPPAPGPVYLSQSDYKLLLETADDLKKKRFMEARRATVGVADPIAKSLGEWLYFMAEDPLVDIADADAFLDSHSDWPAVSRIQAFVERRIPSNAPADKVLAFFDSRDPVTGDGKVQLARALFSKGEKEAGEVYLRDAWINDNFTVSEERAILSSYGGRLNREDHAARVDRLLFARHVTNARRIFSRLDSHERKKAEARAALLLGASSGPSLYRKLSKDDQLDSGVLLAAVRYYRRTGDEQYAISLANQAPKTPEALRNPERWWYERQLLMRWAIKEGRFADAYALAANSSLPPNNDYAEAEFDAGWIALRFLKAPERAETHFLALASSVGTPISLSRAYYWLGRAAQASGEADLADAYYQTAAKHYYSYYGQLASEKLGGGALQQKFSPPSRATPEDKARFGSRETVAALRMLSDLKLDYEFMVFSYSVDDQLDRPGEYLELAALTNGEGAPHLTVRAGKVAIQRHAFTPEVAYPLVFVPDEAARFVSPEIILGLSRQESEFNPRAFSRAGARGMMQLLPSTAQITARKEGLPYRRSALLDDPVYNLIIGSAHLSHLIDRFDGSLILAFAAYNAGVIRVEQWIADYGDPRLDGVDPVDWVELIPFSETRNYVQRVLENTQVYRGRLNDAPIPGRLSADLERGGAQNRVAQRDTVPSLALIALSQDYGRKPMIPPPEETVQRAAEFKIASAALDPAPEPPTPAAEETAKPPAKPAPVKNNRRPRSRRNKTRNVAPPPEPAPAAEQTSAIVDADAAETEAINAETVKAESAAEEDAAATLIEPQAEEQSPENENAADEPVTINDEPLEPVIKPAPTSLSAPAGAPVTVADEDDDVSDEDAGAPGDEPLAADSAAEDAPQEGEDIAIFEPVDDSEFSTATGLSEEEWCRAYREFLARNAEDDDAAAALNARMLEEVQGGACRED